MSPNALPKWMSENGMVWPCSGPASEPNWQGALKTKEHAVSQILDVIGIDIEERNDFSPPVG
jgi:hypothetical protein